METKPRFKNSFGVTGTETEIELFKKEIEKMGWTYQKCTTMPNKKLFLNGLLLNNTLKQGCYWMPTEVAPEKLYILSTPEGWQRALSLAEEREEEVPEYVECIDNDGVSELLNIGSIYEVDKENITEKYFGIKKLNTRMNGCYKNRFKPSTKEAYNRQELLEEAKRRYPELTKIRIKITTESDVTEGVITSHEDMHPRCLDEVWFSVKNATGDSRFLPVYYKGVWAEIIPEEKTPTKEEIERVLNHLKEITK